MKNRLLRLLPPAFFLLIFSEFLLMLKVSEPYPAIIMPPFENTSVYDTPKCSDFNAYIYGTNGQKTKINPRKLFDYASSMTGFFMLRTLADKTPGNNPPPELKADITGLKDALKYVVLASRHQAISKSNRSYQEAKRRIRSRLASMANNPVDSLVFKKTEKTAVWSERQIESTQHHVKTLVFN